MVLVTASKFNGLYKTEEKLAKCFLSEFKKIGLDICDFQAHKYIDDKNFRGTLKAGILRRLSTDNTKYENGDDTDWYGIVMYGVLNKIPSIIVEHAYLSNEDDYKNYLSTNKGLKKLADADVRAIAAYYKLVPKKF